MIIKKVVTDLDVCARCGCVNGVLPDPQTDQFDVEVGCFKNWPKREFSPIGNGFYACVGFEPKRVDLQ